MDWKLVKPAKFYNILQKKGELFRSNWHSLLKYSLSCWNNLIKCYNSNLEYSKAARILIDSTLKYPNYIGGTKSFDTKVIDSSKSKIFCKHGAEGVFLFAHLTKGVSGVVKVTDGNERAIPITIIFTFKTYLGITITFFLMQVFICICCL